MISGCIRITSTGLKNLDFMLLQNDAQPNTKCADGRTSEISDNWALWLHPVQKRKIREMYGDFPINNIDVRYFRDDLECDLAKFVSADYDCTVVKGDIVIDDKTRNNRFKKGIFIHSGTDVNKLKMLKIVHGSIVIRNAPHTTLSFPNLKRILGQTSGGIINSCLLFVAGPVLSIIDNSQLDSIDFITIHVIKSDNSVVPVFLKGKIPKIDAGMLQSAAKKDIECDLEGRELSEVPEVCTMIKGDLVLNKATGTTRTKIHSISGCLRVVDTELDNLDFLDQLDPKKPSSCSGKAEIKGNKKLCLTWGQKSVIEKNFGKPIEYTPDESCELTCNEAEFEEPNSQCSIFIGDLTITGLKTGATKEIMKKVQKIKGKLIVKGNEDVGIDFAQLETVDNSNSDEAAIVVEGENKLKSLAFPKLNKVSTNGGVAVSVKGVKLAKDQAKILSETAGNAFLHECDFGSSEVIDLSELDYCTSISGDLILKNTDGVTNSKVDTISGCLKVIDTQLKDLLFLHDLNENKASDCGGTSEIKGNKDLCLTWGQKTILQSKFGRPIEYTADGGCGLTCTETEFEEPNSQCLTFEGDLTVSGLKSDSPPKEIFKKVKKIVGKLTIAGNADVSFDFTQLEAVDNSQFEDVAITVDGDNKLKSLAFPKLNKASTNGAVAISVNGIDLPKDTAKILAQAVDTKRFVLECRLKSPVAKMSDLDYCTLINGDLLLHKATETTNGKLEWIGGCIQVKDTELKSLDFLKISKPSNSVNCSSVQGVSEIKGNADLCPEWPEIKDLLNGFGQPIEISIDEKCDLPCDLQEFEDVDSFCRKLTEDFIISDGFDPVSLQKIAQKLRIVQGFLHILKTNLTELEFPHLVSIEVKQPETALEISENNQLKTISFPKLESVKTAENTAIMVTENEGFRLSNEMIRVLQNASKDKAFIYECHETPEITSFSLLNGCSRMSSGLRILSSFVNGNPLSSQISLVRGCLQIVDSPLNTLDWLDLKELSGNGCDDEHVIKGNKDLCVYPLKTRELRAKLSNLTISGNKPREECPVYCKAVNGSIPDHECNVVEGDLRVENNCSSDPNLIFVKEIKGTLTISDCHLDSVKTLFPQLKKISAETEAALTLEKIGGDYNVCELEELELESTGDVVLTIDTEKTIPFMDVADLKAKFGESKVAVKNEEKRGKGVCVFVSSAKEVKECERVEGDLLLDEKTKEVDDGLKEISGCLILNKADLKNYGFLAKITKIGDSCRWRNGSSEISGISCIPYKVRRTVKGELKKEVEKEENRKGCYECAGGLTGAKCQVVIGDVIVNGTTSETKRRQLEEIREIYGRLVIRGTTDVERISFKSLETIEALNSSEPAIEVVENKKLKKLEMPLLKKPTSKGKTLVKIANNENLEMTESLRNTLKRITGEVCSETKGAVCHFSKAPQKTTEEGASTGDEKDKEDQGGIGAVGISLIVVGVLLVVAAIAGVAVFFFIKKKKGEKTKEKKTEKKKGAKETMSKEKKKTKASKSKDVVSKSKETMPKSTLSKEQPSKQLASREMDPPAADPPAVPAVDAAPVDAAAAPSDPPPPALPSPDAPVGPPAADSENLVPDAPQPV